MCKDCVFPLHDNFKLYGELKSSNSIFSEIISKKSQFYNNLELVELDKTKVFNKSKFLTDLRNYARERAKSKKESVITKYICQDPDNQDLLNEFISDIETKNKEKDFNFDDAYENWALNKEEDILKREEIIFQNKLKESNIDIDNIKKNQNDDASVNKSNISENPENENYKNKQPGSMSKYESVVFPYLSDDSKLYLQNNLKDFNNYHKNTLMIEQEFYPVSFLFQISLFKPNHMDVNLLKDYFGEKIALYFLFTSSIMKFMIPILIFGLLLWIFQFVIWYFISSTEGRTLQIIVTVLLWVFATSVITWCGFFILKWKHNEEEFLIRSGSFKDDRNKERIGFKNPIYKRSLITDNLNSRTSNAAGLFFRTIASYLCCLLIYGVSFGLTVGIFFIKSAVYRAFPFHEEYVYLDQNIINLLEILKMICFDRLFKMVAVKLVTWVNPKYVREFETIIIRLMTIFGFLNHFWVIIVLVFFKSQIDPCLGLVTDGNQETSYCLKEASVYFRIYTFSKVLFSIIRYTLQFYQLKKLKESNLNSSKFVDIKNNNTTDIKNCETHVEIFTAVSDILPKQLNVSINIANNKNIDKSQLFDSSIYSKVNKSIEKQIFLSTSESSDDFDSSVMQYIEVVEQFAALVFFGILFPLSFALLYFSNYLELVMDRKNYLYLQRRPSSLGNATIGYWNDVISWIFLISIFTNSYILGYLINWFDYDNSLVRDALFLLSLLIGFIIIFLTKIFYTERMSKVL